MWWGSLNPLFQATPADQAIRGIIKKIGRKIYQLVEFISSCIDFFFTNFYPIFLGIMIFFFIIFYIFFLLLNLKKVEPKSVKNKNLQEFIQYQQDNIQLCYLLPIGVLLFFGLNVTFYLNVDLVSFFFDHFWTTIVSSIFFYYLLLFLLEKQGSKFIEKWYNIFYYIPIVILLTIIFGIIFLLFIW